jgi:hypothetical protein
MDHKYWLVVATLVTSSIVGCGNKEKHLCDACCSNSDCSSGLCATFGDQQRLCAEKINGSPTSCCVRISANTESCQNYYYSAANASADEGKCTKPVDPYANCTWDLGTGAEVAGPPPTLNNSADLSGAAIGTVAVDPTNTRRVVSVQMTTPVAGLESDQGYVTRSSTKTEAAFLIVPVRNTGTGYPCGIKATAVRWLNGTSSMGPNSESAFNGSVGTTASGTINSCLAPGETGYINTYATDSAGLTPFSSVTSIEIDLVSAGEGTASAASLIPNSYEVGTCTGGRTLRVQATATGGDASVTVGSGGMISGLMMFLDSDGLPLGAWTHVTTTKSLEITAGESAYFYDGLLSAPAASRARIFVPTFSH